MITTSDFLATATASSISFQSTFVEPDWPELLPSLNEDCCSYPCAKFIFTVARNFCCMACRGVISYRALISELSPPSQCLRVALSPIMAIDFSLPKLSGNKFPLFCIHLSFFTNCLIKHFCLHHYTKHIRYFFINN